MKRKGKTHQRHPGALTSSHDQLEVQDEENHADHMVGVLVVFFFGSKMLKFIGFHAPVPGEKSLVSVWGCNRSTRDLIGLKISDEWDFTGQNR